MPKNSAAHWDQVYIAKADEEVSWFAPRLERSLAWIEAAGGGHGARVVDAGAGRSTLVDALLDRGAARVTLVDLSQAALAQTMARLGAEAGGRVEALVGDVTRQELGRAGVDIWHDRAVFHFLTEPADRERYVRLVRQALRPGGLLVMATFGPRGPTRCSGLPTVRYDASTLLTTLGEGFELIGWETEQHTKPYGGEQEFLYLAARRR